MWFGKLLQCFLSFNCWVIYESLLQLQEPKKNFSVTASFNGVKILIDQSQMLCHIMNAQKIYLFFH
jgi:hypothetical protein